MKKDRVAGIVFKDNTILLMYRINKGKEYYTFPGGGIEPGESNAEALKREVWEETSMNIDVLELKYEVDWDHETKQFFYLCTYISGLPSLGDYNEKATMADGTQYYEPKWVDCNKFFESLVYPLEIKDLIVTDLHMNRKSRKQDLFLKLETCRQVL